MRILWIAPWGRPLAHVYLDELIRRGHEVRLVTTTAHFQKWERARREEIIVRGTAKAPGGWPSVVRAVRAVRAFRPQVTVTEEFTDARLLALLPAAPHVTLTHDHEPHDATEENRWYQQRVARQVERTCAVRVAYSDFVSGIVAARTAAAVPAVPLPSEAGEDVVPPFVPADGRRDVVLIGRIHPYKNLPGTFEGWARHVGSDAYRGDRLLVIGDGNERDLTLPPQCEWRRGHFQFADLMPTVAAAKASLVYYSQASQSGVQVLSMQCGTVPVVSDVGALPEFQPPGERAVPLGDAERLAAAIGELADPLVAAARGQDARRHYEKRHAPGVAVDGLLDVLDRVRRRD